MNRCRTFAVLLLCFAAGTAYAVNTPPSITAPADPIRTVTQDAVIYLGLTGVDDGNVFFWSSAAGPGVASVTTDGIRNSQYGYFTVKIQPGFSGTASFTASLSDTVNPPVTRTINIAVMAGMVNAPPVIDAFASPIAVIERDTPNVTLTFTGSDDNGTLDWVATPGSGVNTVHVMTGNRTSQVWVGFAPKPVFTGTATFNITVSDAFNPPVTYPVTVIVNGAPPPPLDHVVISQVYGGGGTSDGIFKHDFVELYNPDTVAHDLSGWTIQYSPASLTTWQVQPLGGTIAPGEYYLIRLGTNGTAGWPVPEANVHGTMNLSGSSGKVALVRNGYALSGCVLTAPVVDLVGYGPHSCREGSTSVQALNNGHAALRKNDGFYDTNVNGADFVVARPSPRRTTPIVELPPSVLTVEPRHNGTNVPRDASITVDFTEPVDLQDGWFSISCAATGLHGSATVAQGGPNTWIIIPNANFQAGEQCTITVNKAFVRDSDFDDGGTNTDLLTHDYSATFAVATGAAPPYPSSVHLTMGMPAPAETSLDSPNAYLMEKPEYTLSYNRDRGIANWVSWHLADEWIGSLARVDTFRADPAVPPEWFRVNHTSYAASGFDRGHLVPNTDRDRQTALPVNQATFLMTNMIPQAPDSNEGPWASLERYLRTLLPANELYIIAGGSGNGGTGTNGFATTIAGGQIAVPAVIWKVVLVLPKADGDDVSRVTAGARTIAVVMPNTQGPRNVNWMTHLTTVDAVEQLTGYDFFSEVEDAVESAIEAGVNGVNPPGVADQSVNTDEDVATSFTLQAANAGTSALTYTIVSVPAHGTLSGTDANRTYTPAPEFSGTDSFTFRVSDGSLTSRTATMTITVYPVNDPPVATLTAPATGVEGSAVTATVTATDVEGDALSYSWTVTKDGAPFSNGTGPTIAFTPADNGAYAISATASDGTASGTATAAVNVANAAPSISSVTGPAAPFAVGGSSTITVIYADPGSADTHLATFTWSDGAVVTGTCSGGTCTATRVHAAAGIYSVAIAVADDDGATAGSSFGNVVVYDVNGGFVSGAGWISTPSGKQNLNVNVKYQQGSAAPSGSTKFDLGRSQFESTSLDWLVVSGNTATFQGTGTIDGAGSYGFTVTVVDGADDSFAARVFDKATNATIHQLSGTLGAGRLTVHQ
jgi:endonuclease G, mitochondrial